MTGPLGHARGSWWRFAVRELGRRAASAPGSSFHRRRQSIVRRHIGRALALLASSAWLAPMAAAAATDPGAVDDLLATQPYDEVTRAAAKSVTRALAEHHGRAAASASPIVPSLLMLTLYERRGALAADDPAGAMNLAAMKQRFSTGSAVAAAGLEKLTTVGFAVQTANVSRTFALTDIGADAVRSALQQARGDDCWIEFALARWFRHNLLQNSSSYLKAVDTSASPASRDSVNTSLFEQLHPLFQLNQASAVRPQLRQVSLALLLNAGLTLRQLALVAGPSLPEAFVQLTRFAAAGLIEPRLPDLLDLRDLGYSTAVSLTPQGQRALAPTARLLQSDSTGQALLQVIGERIKTVRSIPKADATLAEKRQALGNLLAADAPTPQMLDALEAYRQAVKAAGFSRLKHGRSPSAAQRR